MSGLMKWPGTTDKSNKPDLSSLSDDELDERMVEAGLMEQDDLDREHNSLLLIALTNLPGGPAEYHETLAGLMKLRDEGPFPFEAQDLYDRLLARAVADVKAAHKAAPKVTSSPADVAPDTSMAGWLKDKWASADATVRHSLRLLADALGIDVPLTRTRRTHQAEILINDKDSSPRRRASPSQHPNRDDSDELLDRPVETQPKERGYHDPPEWDDNDADGWEPSTSLHDALYPDNDRGGWY